MAGDSATDGQGGLPTTRTVVAIASDRSDLVSALRNELATRKRFDLVPRAADGPRSLLKLLEECTPDLLLLDRGLLDRLDERQKGALRERSGDLRVLLVCDVAQRNLVREVVSHRFHGFLLTRQAPDHCTKAIDTVVRGELWLPRALLEQAVLEAGRVGGTSEASQRKRPQVRLTNRESQAVEQLRKGLTNKEIASKLGIREDTVKKHLYNIYNKLGVRSRSQLLAIYARR